MLHFVLTLVTAAVILGLVFYFIPKGWRTIVANLAASVPILGSILASLASVDLTQYLDKSVAEAAMLAIVVANIIMRSLTTSPVGEK